MGTSYLTPEDLALLESGPGLDAQTANLQRQLAAAEALRGRPMPKHSTPWGTVLGGLGNIVGNVGAGMQAADLQSQLDSALKRQGAAGGVGARLKALMDQQRLQAGDQDIASGKAEADAKAAELARATNPAGARATLGGQLLQRLGAKVPAGAAPADYMPMLPLIEKASESEQRSKDRALTRQMMTGRDSAAANALTPQALDMLAEQFAATGKLPALGMGKAAAELRMKIATRAQELRPGVNLAAAGAGYGADAGALKQMQVQADRVDAFEKTAIANLDQAIGAAAQVVDMGSPWFNKPARAVAQGLAGSPDMQRYITARQVAVQEVAKVLSGAMGNAAVSDSARHEVEALLGPDASLAQIKAAADVLKVDMANRKQAMQEQLAEIRGRTGGGGNTRAGAPITSTSGKVRVTNGTEMLEIDAADLAEAERDGFRRAP